MVDNVKPAEDEFELAQQMKNFYCDISGKETNSAKAAVIIHQIGLVYRKRSPDKMSLIRSAGLFNAAIIRYPSKVLQIKIDRCELCQHVLQLADAQNQNLDLVKKAEQVKHVITDLRSEVGIFFQTLVPKLPANTSKDDRQKLIADKVSAIRHINKKIADKIKQIMADLSKFCEEVMGKPPCEYAVVGMGSLAREEITTYSDFEHIILLHDNKSCKSYLDYFKWFSVIFHVTILNLQETIIPSLNVSSLNDKNSRLKDWYYDAITPRGISFDGMMPHACKFPLGRLEHTKDKQFTTELIKPVSEMLEYLSSEADIKNGYHLADILTKTCFVFGNESIFQQFENGVQKYREQKSQADTICHVYQQVKDDLNKFSARFRLTELKSQDTINIKQFVYRSTTIFISALATIYRISGKSCFDIIGKMEKHKKITKNTAEKLQYAIAIACEMRLRVYTKKKSQCDNDFDMKQEGIEKFLNIVGVPSTISYFQIAYCLQCEIAKQLKFTKLHFYSDPQLINYTIGLVFGIREMVSFLEDPKKHFWDSSEFNFDTCMQNLEEKIRFRCYDGLFQRLGKKVSEICLRLFEGKGAQQSVNKPDFGEKHLISTANYLYLKQIYDEALEFYKQLLDGYEHKLKKNKRNCEIIAWCYRVGVCLNQLNQPKMH